MKTEIDRKYLKMAQRQVRRDNRKKFIKTLLWNIGLLIIRLGYKIRGNGAIYPPYKIHEAIGRRVLQLGYFVRGKIPMKRWLGNHC